MLSEINKIYFKDLNPKSLIFPISIFIILISISSSLELIPEFIWNIFRDFKYDNIIIAITFTVIFLICIYRFYRNWRKGLYITINSITQGIVWLICLIYIQSETDKIIFYTFNIFNYNISIPYLIFGSLFFILSKYKTYNPIESINESPHFIEDDPDPEFVEDKFYTEAYSENLIKFINNSSPKNSFGILINGEWGSGKTYILKKIESNLNEEHITINFNPWKFSSSTSISESFFTTLKDALKKYDSSVIDNINAYASEVVGDIDNSFAHTIKGLIRIFNPRKSIEDIHQSINKTIQLSGKKIIVFIDDLDRLTSDEILEILKLIRNTANFKNTFFIVAADSEYLINVISNSNTINNVDTYLEKIFQICIDIPLKNNEIINILFEELFLSSNKLYEDILIELKQISSYLINTYVPENTSIPLNLFFYNPRNIKRLINNFNFVYNLTHEFIEIKDLFVLEIIKLSNPKLYQKIKNNEFKEIYAKKDDLETLLKNLKLNYSQQDIILLVYVFNVSDKKNFARFSNSITHINYFSYHLFKSIKPIDYNKALTSDEDVMFQQFSNWFNKDKATFNNIIQETNQFIDDDQFIRFVCTLLRLNYKSMIFQAYEKFNQRYENYFIKDNYHRIVDAIVKNSKIKAYNRAYFLNYTIPSFKDFIDSSTLEDFNIQNHITGKTETYNTTERHSFEVFTQKINEFIASLNHYLLDLLKEDIKTDKNDFFEFNELFTIYGYVRKYCERDLIEATNTVKEYLNQNIKNYLQNIFINTESHSFKLLHTKLFFQEKKEFEKLLDSINDDDPNIKRIKSIVKDSLEEYYDKGFISHKDLADKEFINNIIASYKHKKD